MGKSVRTVLLSVSATLAIAMFIMLWAVRPGSDSAVLDEARARQDQSLVEISRPLETDIQAISDAEALSKEAMEIILSDEDFLARLAEALVTNQSLMDAIVAELDPEATTLVADAIVGFIEDNRAEFDRIIGEEIVSYVAANYDVGIGIVNSELEAYARENSDVLVELIRSEVEKRISQALNDNLSAAAIGVPGPPSAITAIVTIPDF